MNSGTHSTLGEIKQELVEPLDGEVVDHGTHRADDYVQVGVWNYHSNIIINIIINHHQNLQVALVKLELYF